MRISDWSSDVCSSDLDYRGCCTDPASGKDFMPAMNVVLRGSVSWSAAGFAKAGIVSVHQGHQSEIELTDDDRATGIWAMSDRLFMPARSEEHTSELQSLMRNTYDVFGLKKKKNRFNIST